MSKNSEQRIVTLLNKLEILEEENKQLKEKLKKLKRENESNS